MESTTTVKGLFAVRDRIFRIPAYQRAYSWEKDKHIKQFISDLKYQPKGKKYFLGHFLFEQSDENKFFVIDGQQRLTTIVIFFSCLHKELQERITQGEAIEERLIRRLKEDYLDDYGRKFRTVYYDDPFFENVVIRGCDSGLDDTKSKKRIKDARDCFSELLENTTKTEEILHWKEIIEEADITTYVVSNKVQATQIFSFQNDRGKVLTN